MTRIRTINKFATVTRRPVMLHIDLEVLSTVSKSQFRDAVENGYRWLRFDAALETQFQEFYTESHLTRTRLAGYLGLFMFALFSLIDISTLPTNVWPWTISIRVGLVMPSFIIALIISYRAAWRIYLPHAVFGASLITGLGTVAVIGAALWQNFQIPYEGILLVALFIYLIVCLQWWHALLINLLILLAFVGIEILFQKDPQARLYQIVFMLAANAVGAYGGYFMEYSTRTGFLVNSMLNELAEHDGLTGLFNRRTLNIHLDTTWRQAMRDNQNLAVAMIDVDHFKSYNDRYGHGQGDIALKAVADVVASQARRPLDLAARYGGEEFVVVWYHPAGAELPKMAENLRAAVAALGMAHERSEFGCLSVSIGVALMKPSTAQTYADLLRDADVALYEAKEQGRNRVVVHL
jgi:diguanylate cyclase (GGDEF)-like protein